MRPVYDFGFVMGIALGVTLTVHAIACCTPAVSPAPVDRDGRGTALGKACEHLRALGCPEGQPNRRGRTCFETMTSAAKVAPVPDACLHDAPTQDAVRSCGTVDTVRVRCFSTR